MSFFCSITVTHQSASLRSDRFEVIYILNSELKLRKIWNHNEKASLKTYVQQLPKLLSKGQNLMMKSITKV